eukprot:314461_1
MTGAVPHDYSLLELNASQRPFDNDQPNTKMSWTNFSTFYQTANKWNFPIQAVDEEEEKNEDNNTQNNHKNGLPPPNNDNNTADMFVNRGSRQSVDILADEMSAKWSFNPNNPNPTAQNNASSPITVSNSNYTVLQSEE